MCNLDGMKCPECVEYAEHKCEVLGQELDRWQLVARDLARAVLAEDTDWVADGAFAQAVINELSNYSEMNINPKEVIK